MKTSNDVNLAQVSVYNEGNIRCLYSTQFIETFHPEMLSSSYWQRQNKIVGQAQGRGTTYFIKQGALQWVLKHYYRGGLIGKLIRDQYFFKSVQSSRSFKEFTLLTTMQQQNLPCPKPVACKIIKSGLFYRADLLTSRVENAEDLVAIMQHKALPEAIWFNIGKVIKQFHQQGIYHHDLNAHNILLDDNDKIWLIDFDRGEQRTIATSWQEANLARLLRSFNKEMHRLSNFHWQQQNWQQLLQGYHA